MLWSFAHVSIRESAFFFTGYRSWLTCPQFAAMVRVVLNIRAISLMELDLVRPEFTGTLAIKSGRHPILENVQSAGTVVSNDAYCCDSSSFQIIQGPK